MGTPGARLQGPFVNGSAAALVSEVPMPVPTVPARATPRPSNARRLSKPLPATESGGATALASLRPLRLSMISLLWQRPEPVAGGLFPDDSLRWCPHHLASAQRCYQSLINEATDRDLVTVRAARGRVGEVSPRRSARWHHAGTRT